MAWKLVPIWSGNFDFFGRQRDLFSDWLEHFDDDWRAVTFNDSLRRFDRELDRVRRELYKMDAKPSILNVEQPFITDPSGNRKLSLRFDCSQFKPEEITVKTLDNKLNVHAKHIEEGKGRKSYQEFTREYTLPENVDPKQLKSHLSSDGVLEIEAPAPKAVEAPKEVLIPIEHLHSKENSDKGDKK
ncbi:heat shock protein beta-1-like [Mercenaria mercenaria]|uniref:heat shock protein beta-1-like n=1 Tax=Mercenaria mercenaria TaxID=6596 RepID=UPI001E1DC040|nr:heat shock protein beta-1-like [Mercenaria mercenaria]